MTLGRSSKGTLRDDEITDYADAARRLNLTRARVTQITNLILLAPEIQEAILDMPLRGAGATIRDTPALLTISTSGEPRVP